MDERVSIPRLKSIKMKNGPEIFTPDFSNQLGALSDGASYLRDDYISLMDTVGDQIASYAIVALSEDGTPFVSWRIDEDRNIVFFPEVVKKVLDESVKVYFSTIDDPDEFGYQGDNEDL